MRDGRYPRSATSTVLCLCAYERRSTTPSTTASSRTQRAKAMSCALSQLHLRAHHMLMSAVCLCAGIVYIRLHGMRHTCCVAPQAAAPCCALAGRRSAAALRRLRTRVCQVRPVTLSPPHGVTQYIRKGNVGCREVAARISGASALVWAHVGNCFLIVNDAWSTRAGGGGIRSGL